MSFFPGSAQDLHESYIEKYRNVLNLQQQQQQTTAGQNVFSENVDLSNVNMRSVNSDDITLVDVDKFQTEKEAEAGEGGERGERGERAKRAYPPLYPRPGQTAEIPQTDGAFDSSIREKEEDKKMLVI